MQWDLILLENEGRSCEVEKPCLSLFKVNIILQLSEIHHNPIICAEKWTSIPVSYHGHRRPQTAASQLTSQLLTAKGKEVEAINKINPKGSNRTVPDRKRKLWKRYLEYKSNDKRSAGKCMKHVESIVKCIKLSAAFMCEWCESVTVRLWDADATLLKWFVCL